MIRSLVNALQSTKKNANDGRWLGPTYIQRVRFVFDHLTWETNGDAWLTKHGTSSGPSNQFSIIFAILKS